jgi:hypothetical protein
VDGRVTPGHDEVRNTWVIVSGIWYKRSVLSLPRPDAHRDRNGHPCYFPAATRNVDIKAQRWGAPSEGGTATLNSSLDVCSLE